MRTHLSFLFVLALTACGGPVDSKDDTDAPSDTDTDTPSDDGGSDDDDEDDDDDDGDDGDDAVTLDDLPLVDVTNKTLAETADTFTERLEALAALDDTSDPGVQRDALELLLTNAQSMASIHKLVTGNTGPATDPGAPPAEADVFTWVGSEIDLDDVVLIGTSSTTYRADLTLDGSADPALLDGTMQLRLADPDVPTQTDVQVFLQDLEITGGCVSSGTVQVDYDDAGLGRLVITYAACDDYTFQRT